MLVRQKMPTVVVVAVIVRHDVCVYVSNKRQTIANYHGSNTVFLVGVLMSVVGGVFVTFALMALCYRSVVVHNNFSLCLRLVIFFDFFSSDCLLFPLYQTNKQIPTATNRKPCKNIKQKSKLTNSRQRNQTNHSKTNKQKPKKNQKVHKLNSEQ